MEKYIVLIHAGIAVLFLLYLFVRLFFSIFKVNDKEYQDAIRSRFIKSDWVFTILLLITGLYPIVVLGDIELYHMVKLLILVAILWGSRYVRKLNFALISLASIAFLIYAGYASFTDKPAFPKAQGTFEQDHPEIAGLNEIEKGERIFTTLCVQCHGHDGTKGLFGAADLSRSPYSLEQKLETITDGSPLTVMRSFAKELSDEELEAVAKYVHELVKR